MEGKKERTERSWYIHHRSSSPKGHCPIKGEEDEVEERVEEGEDDKVEEEEEDVTEEGEEDVAD